MAGYIAKDASVSSNLCRKEIEVAVSDVLSQVGEVKKEAMDTWRGLVKDASVTSDNTCRQIHLAGQSALGSITYATDEAVAKITQCTEESILKLKTVTLTGLALYVCF